MNSRTCGCGLLALLVSACQLPDKQIGDGDGDTQTEEGNTDADPPDTDTPDTGPPEGQVIPLPVHHDVDILFVIDNSGSMGEEQALLVANAASIIEILEVEANYRIGITTTDNGNPWCPPGTTTPEAGRLVMSSCRSRIEDFVFNSGETDVTQLACEDICTLSEAELEILPTTTELDADAKPRPWLERIEGKTNLPEGTDMAAAFACFSPQGINGCGFESQLESMYLALTRAQDPSETNHGFLRESAALVIVFVTDEVDCSYNADYASIFEQDGNKVFWSDPAESFPSSAVCWNAGVECSGDPSAYDSCDSINKGVTGELGVPDAQAVLHPMSRYSSLLAAIEHDKQQLDPTREVTVTLIAGVSLSGEAHYADVSNSDPEFQYGFGIGPGCEAQNPLDPNEPVQAVPPVRLRELSEAFSPDNMFSICAQDYSPTFEGIAEAVQTQIEPICYAGCVKDMDPQTAILDAECVVEEDPPGADNTTPIEECLRDAEGYVEDPQTKYSMPSAEVDVCYAMRVDANDHTEDPRDDLAAYCADLNYNLELKIVRRPGSPASKGTTAWASCDLAQYPELSCPGLGG